MPLSLRHTGLPQATQPRTADASQPPGMVDDVRPPQALPDESGHAWLVWQCQMITGTLQGEIFALSGRGKTLASSAIWPANAAPSAALARLAVRAMAEKIPFRERAEGRPEPGPPRGDLLVHPVLIDGQVRAVVALLLEPRSELQLRAVTQLLRWGIVWFETLLQAPAGAQAQTQDATAPLRILQAAQEVRPLRAATVAVCDALGARYQFDRVAVGLRKGLGTHLVGTSSSAAIDPNSSLRQDLEAAMTEACDLAATVSYPNSMLPALCHQALARRHGLAYVVTIPLAHGDTQYGAVTLACVSDEQPSAERLAELTALAPTLGFQLWLAQCHERALGRRLRAVVERVVSARAIVVALLVLTTVLSIIPGPYRLAGSARIEGTVQRAVVAPVDGFLSDTSVRAGDTVTKDAALARLEDRDLALERQKSQSEFDRHAQAYSEALALHQRAQAGVARARMGQAQADLHLVDERLARTTLRAPFAGIVVSGDFSQALGTPVTRGQVLFEIAPLDHYRVITEVDERDIGELAPAQHGHLRLAGMPEQRFPVTVERIAPVAQTENGRTFFRVESRLDSPDTKIRPGMQGVAKFDAGERPLLWCWTHGLWSRLRLWLWSFGA